jgi:glycosyltransferase involved in cell wall biosynthesis
MHVAVVNLTSGGLSGGYRSYLKALVPRLREDTRIRKLDVFVPPAAVPGLVASGLVGLATWPEADHRRGFPALRRQLALSGPDVVFVPSARHLDLGRPCVVMVRNMEPLECPLAGHTVAAGLRNLARAYEARRACRRADRVIAVSEHVSRFLVGRWRVPAAKIGVVHHGVELPSSQAARPAVLADQERPFLFTAGSIRPARGLDDLLAALAAIERPPLLVVAGAPDPDTERHSANLKARASALGIGVLWAGALDGPEMAWCFSHCEAFVMTSRAEACPNIALEAMCHGCYVISTDHPPMPEVFGSAAIYYSARDAEDLRRRLTELRDLSASDALRRRQEARERSQAFTWSETARRTVNELESAFRRS